MAFHNNGLSFKTFIHLFNIEHFRASYFTDWMYKSETCWQCYRQAPNCGPRDNNSTAALTQYL